jgi:hypothetical protein
MIPAEHLALGAREVPLGGTRAMTVRRTLPNRDIRTVGPWCFVDHYGPHVLSGGQRSTGASLMDVPPHPHTGLQTVSWLLEGSVEHRDSLGSLAVIRPGELNLMTSGLGIAHSEVSPGSTDRIHGVQLWVALPDEHRHQAPHFETHTDLPTWTDSGIAGTVIVGAVGGATSPAVTYSPIVGAHLVVAAGAAGSVPLDPGFEHAVLLLSGTASADRVDLTVGDLLYLGGSRDAVRLAGPAPGESCEPAHVLLIGGAPFEEDLLMWWNFVGRSHDEIVADREDWAHGRRFGAVLGYPGDALPAPGLPTTVLRARPRRR